MSHTAFLDSVHQGQEELAFTDQYPLDGRPRMSTSTFLKTFLSYERAIASKRSMPDVVAPELATLDPLADCGVCAMLPAHGAPLCDVL
jgi:hypothetical protein